MPQRFSHTRQVQELLQPNWESSDKTKLYKHHQPVRSAKFAGPRCHWSGSSATCLSGHEQVAPLLVLLCPVQQFRLASSMVLDGLDQEARGLEVVVARNPQCTLALVSHLMKMGIIWMLTEKLQTFRLSAFVKTQQQISAFSIKS